MRIRLTRKLAPYLDGIDVSACHEGDVLDLPWRQAELLIAESWATIVLHESRRQSAEPPGHRTSSSDRPARSARLIEQLGHTRKGLETGEFDPHEDRRVEDRIREELRDARAKIVRGPRPPGKRPSH